MNERFKELENQCWEQCDGFVGFDIEEFAKLIVKDVTNLLRQEWFNENNGKEETDKREIAIRLGKKLAYMRSVDLIVNHFGVE